MKRGLIGLLLGSLLWTAGALANQVSYQGILTNSEGDSLLSGTYDFSFAIFSTPTGGTARWSEAHTDVQVQNGVYSVLLGETTALPDSIGTANWLEITVEATTLAPRLPITADFRAIEARHAQNADSVNHIAARTTPTANHLLPLDATGKFPESVLPFTLDSILAGQGLTGVSAATEQRGRSSLDERLTLNVGAGTGITVSADQVSATLGTSIATAEIEDNAVTSGKVQDNTLTSADIAPDIVSSVDGVHNDGGDIDLIAGANITIVPDDVNNTITFTAAGGGGGYSAGQCIALNGTVIENTMSIVNGDSCIRVTFDPNTCTYVLSSDLDVYAGDCIEVEYDDVTCDWTVSVDPACVDSIYDTEIYAESFVVVGDGTFEDPAAHLRNDGGLEMRDGEGNEVYLNPNGTMVMVHDGVPVGGFDPNGEFYGQSFMVIDPETGDTLSHLNNQGGLELLGEDGALHLNPNGTMVMIQNGQVVGGFDPNGEFAAKSYMVIDPETGDTLIHLTSVGVIEGKEDDFVYSIDPYFGISMSDSAGQHGSYLTPFGEFGLFVDGHTIIGSSLNGEFFAKSFEIRDSLNGPVKAHLDNSGNLSLPDGAQITVGGVPIAGGEGDTIRRDYDSSEAWLWGKGLQIFDSSDISWIFPDSIWTGERSGTNGIGLKSDGRLRAVQGGNDVAGVDASGEMFAKSFYVWDPVTGDTLIHLTNEGNIELQGELFGEPYNSRIRNDHIGVSGPNGSSSVNAGSVQVYQGGPPTDGHYLGADGTWSAQQGSHTVAGLDSSGEIFARSFYTIDDEGDTVAHLDNAGNLALPDGAQVTVGGVPLGGGGVGDEIQFTDGNLNTLINAGGVAVFDGDGTTSISAGDLSVGGGNSGIGLNQNGTWSAGQNGVTVAGLQDNGEIHAKSFEVRDSAGGPIKAHLTNSGGLAATGTVSAPYVTGTTSVYTQNINGSTTLFSDMSAGSIRSQTLMSNVQTAGWTFFNNGTMTQWVDPPGGAPPMLNMSTTNDGYWQFAMPVFFGNPANFNYLSGGTSQQGIMTSGNFTINGKANVTGAVDPIICELFPAHPGYQYVPGTVVVADRNSDYVIPCHDFSQTGVIGVVTPDEKVDERGHIMITILGYAAAFRQDGTRMEMRVKADAKYGAIKRGDLLTTSETPGHAMLASEPKLGTIVGKALESLDSGTGEIKVMVTLQ